jgi:hypothetical protein
MQKGRYLTLYPTKDGLRLVPTQEGIEVAGEALVDGPTHDVFYEMLEDFLGNGWGFVPPEDIGAMTDAPILSQDGCIKDDGDWEPYDQNAVVYAHMSYEAEDPVEIWANGGDVFFKAFGPDFEVPAGGFSFDGLSKDDLNGMTEERFVEALVDEMKREILDDVGRVKNTAGETMPQYPKSFSELHDYVDANMYGDSVWGPVFGPWMDSENQEILDLMNEAIVRVDKWLRARAKGGFEFDD